MGYSHLGDATQPQGDRAEEAARIEGLRDVDERYRRDVLPDGREVVIVGDVDRLAEGCARQGDNSLGYQGTCGLCSVADVVRQFGGEVTENDVVSHADRRRLCQRSSDPARAGGTTPRHQVSLLRDYGIDAGIDRHRSLDQLATNIESGRGVILGVDAGVLWGDRQYVDPTGRANHAIVATGVARDRATGEVAGFYINDSGTGRGGQFVDARTMARCHLDRMGTAVVTDQARPGR